MALVGATSVYFFGKSRITVRWLLRQAVVRRNGNIDQSTHVLPSNLNTNVGWRSLITWIRSFISPNRAFELDEKNVETVSTTGGPTVYRRARTRTINLPTARSPDISRNDQFPRTWPGDRTCAWTRHGNAVVREIRFNARAYYTIAIVRENNTETTRFMLLERNDNLRIRGRSGIGWNIPFAVFADVYTNIETERKKRKSNKVFLRKLLFICTTRTTYIYG